MAKKMRKYEVIQDHDISCVAKRYSCHIETGVEEQWKCWRCDFVFTSQGKTGCLYAPCCGVPLFIERDEEMTHA